MELANQIVGLLATVVGLIVTALAVPDTTWKRRAIICIGVIGLLQLVFVILGWEKNQNTAYLITAFTWIWQFVVRVISLPLLHGVAILVAGLVGGWWLSNFSRKRFGALLRFPKRDKRSWLSSFAICGLAGADLVGKRNDALAAYDASKRGYQDAEHKKDEVLSGLGPFASLTETPTPELAEAKKLATAATYKFHLAGEELERLEGEIADRLHAALEAGHLLARGFLPPFSSVSLPVDIPAEQWRFLRFDKDYQKAEGHGVTYVGVAVTNPNRRPVLRKG